jgi:hypothetical protein
MAISMDNAILYNGAAPVPFRVSQGDAHQAPRVVIVTMAILHRREAELEEG